MSKLLALLALCSLLSTGIVVARSSQCDCNFLTDSPVCGDNDKTYNNREELRCFNKCHNTNVQVKVEGACPSCDYDANRLSFPVCGSDGRTYESPSVVICRNECLYSQITSYKEGKCKPGDKTLDTFSAQKLHG